MDLTEIAHRLGNIEGKLDKALEEIPALRERVDGLESTESWARGWIRGVVVVMGLISAVIIKLILT